MKTILQILSFGIVVTFISCGQPAKKEDVAVLKADTIQSTYDKKEKERLERRSLMDEQDYADSIRLDKVLQDALKTSNQNIDKERFSQKYEILLDRIPVTVEINFDYHYTKSNPHLVIRRNEPSAIYIDIYSKVEDRFEKVISHKQWAMTYVNDTIRDINGDGINDFVVNWYGASGCCLKAFSNIYLLRQDKKRFSQSFEFINPTFSSVEKIIRGVGYGHPGKTELYKYKWNGEKVDTLEYVSYQTKETDMSIKTGKVIVSASSPYGDKAKILKVLNSVPTEYRKIEGFDWFTGKGYE